MSQSPIVDRIRIIPRPDDFLDRNVGSSGELYYSKEANTLRVYGGNKRGGYELVSEDNIRRNVATQQVATVKYNVTVTGPQEGDSGNKYNLNNQYQPRIDLIVGYTYYFDQSDSTNAYYPNQIGEAFNIHPLAFSTTADGTNNGGVEYTEGVVYLLDELEVTKERYLQKFSSTTSRAVMITVTTSTPETLYYYCTNHAGMGNEAKAALPGSGGNKIVTSETAPEDPENGNLWWNSTNGVLYVYVEDNDSGQWVQPSVPTNIELQGGFNQVDVEGTNILLYSGQVLNFAGGENITLTPTVGTRTIEISAPGVATEAWVTSQMSGMQTGVDLTAFSVGPEPAGSGNGSLTYNNQSGVFTYTPPDLSSFLGLNSISVAVQTASGNGALSYNSTTGVFSFTPPNLSSYITGETDTLATVTARGASTTATLSVADVTSSGTITADTFETNGAGTPTLDSASSIVLNAADGVRVTGTGPFRLPSLSTTARDNLTPANGDMIYNTTANKVQVYENNAWANVI